MNGSQESVLKQMGETGMVRRQMALRAAVFAFGLTLSALVYAGPLGVRPDGTVIVVPNAPHERESAAARLLQEWLRKACRAETGFEILAEDKLGDAQGRAVLALGRTKWAPAEAAKLYRDGFIIRREGERVVIAGGEPAGTFFGAAHFLDKFCGVRFYMPGDLFTSLPEKPEVTLPDAVDITEEPFVKNCTMTGVANMPAVEGPWLQRSTAHRKESFSHQHSMFQRFPPEQFAQRFPEIYPILKGQRYIPQAANDQRWQPCLSEPKLLDAAEESAIAYFQKTPEVNFISFSVQDSHEFCQCPRCQAEVDKHRVADAKFGDVTAYSLMNATFINRLAERLEKKLPDKTIVYIAYAKVRRPPPFKLHRNVMPVLVFTIADTIIDRVLEPGGNIPLDRWAEVSRRFGHHDWGEGMGYLIPRSYIGLTAQVARFVKQKGLSWGYAHFEAYPNWGLDGPKLYLTPKIWWNPDVDVDPLWRQFCADMFPQAQG
ncbi:MAG: DUF4838 domain-containing protein, partial [Planctomycetes bacterium]|nr:DUF4838 domain-containing protein [Planctomycetota bacterium]